MSKNPVVWFEIYVDDAARAQRFYETVLDIQLQPLDLPPGEYTGMTMLGFPAAEDYGATGALVHMQGMPAGGSGTVIYFSCDDCAVEESRVEAAGGRVETPKMPIGEHGFCSMVFDTEGNMIGLHSTA